MKMYVQLKRKIAGSLQVTLCGSLWVLFALGLAGAHPAVGPARMSSRVVADVVITGKVTDTQGQPLPGVNVLLKGSSRGTSADASGTYSLSVPGPLAVLVFSFVGYQRQEITVGNRSTVNVTLQATDNSLSEVVVTGYSTQQRRDITGAVASVDTKDLIAVPATNFAQ